MAYAVCRYVRQLHVSFVYMRMLEQLLQNIRACGIYAGSSCILYATLDRCNIPERRPAVTSRRVVPGSSSVVRVTYPTGGRAGEEQSLTLAGTDCSTQDWC